VSAIAGDGVIGRPHVARAMIEAGVISSVDEAFTPQWIGPGGRAHVSRYALDPVDAIALVHAAGGVTSLAHPLALTRGWLVPDALIVELALAGLDAVEVAHPDHDLAQRNQLSTAARRLGLAATGGSDDHGQLTGDRIGCEWTGQEDLARLLERATGAPVIAR
jgi:predicted metal-dependent phosphoesterase TrpH